MIRTGMPEGAISYDGSNCKSSVVIMLMVGLEVLVAWMGAGSSYPTSIKS